MASSTIIILQMFARENVRVSELISQYEPYADQHRMTKRLTLRKQGHREQLQSILRCQFPQY